MRAPPPVSPNGEEAFGEGDRLSPPETGGLFAVCIYSAIRPAAASRSAAASSGVWAETM